MKYSLIVPVFNRPDEVDELLDSLTRQSFQDFEVLIVEDGSSVPCKDVVDRYQSRLNVRYFQKENTGPGMSRNYGAERAQGEYLIILDSDVIVPPGYLAEADRELLSVPAQAFGGPDRAHESFSSVQKAINYSMTSFFTTGGIRGGKKKMDKFYPRSFNMGVKASLYNELGGFSQMRFGEDIDFSIRIFKSGAECRLFPGAWVYHKRRTDFRKFFRQVFNSGTARISLYKKYPESLKLVHLLPAVFTVGVALLLVVFVAGLILSCLSGNEATRTFGSAMCKLAVLPVLVYSLLLFICSSIENRSIKVGLLSVPAAFIQLLGYGAGFISAWWHRCVLGKSEYSAFVRNFYK